MVDDLLGNHEFQDPGFARWVQPTQPALPTCQPSQLASPGQPTCKPACLPRQRVCTVFLWSENHVLRPSRGGLRPGISLATTIFMNMLFFRQQETLLPAPALCPAVLR